jgi:nuclear pore complex protein Nup88
LESRAIKGSQGCKVSGKFNSTQLSTVINFDFFQILVPSSSPNFSISKVSVSNSGTFVSLSGQQGVSIMEMPLRWGVDGIYQDGKAKITCQTFNLHEHSANHLEVIQTRWHPSSPTDSHLLIMLSDNSLRIYDESNLKHVWRCGPIPNYAAVEKNLSYLQSLGDIAVDFDIAPAKLRDDMSHNFNDTIDGNIDSINNTLGSLSITAKRNQQEKKIEWPIVILRGNGSIFVLIAGLNTEKPRLQGPLTMVPSQKDNYGDDSCSLLVIPTLPPTIVIAENSGILHHALMIESPPEDSSFDETKTILKNDWELYVLETIELELGLSEDKTKDSSATPISLKRDPINEQRYFCYHDTGLHGVTIGFVQQLQSYVNDDSEMEPNMNVKSRAEYILSTKAFNSSKVNAVVGVGLLQSPSGLFVILGSGQVVSLNTLKLSLSVIPDVSSAPSAAFSDNKISDRKIPFDQHIKGLLSSGVTQPILKLDKTKPPTSQQAFELLMNAIQVMRENQFKRHDQVRQEIAKRMKILEFMKNQQKDEIAQLFESKELIQEKAYKLADMHEDIMERQQNIQKRVQDVLRLASLRLPSGGSSEKEFTDQVKKIKTKTDKLHQDVKQIKAKNDIQRKQLETQEKAGEDAIKALPPKQEESIKEILVDMTKQISSLQKDVQKVNSIIDV